jgi:hypothetical protein
MLKAQRSLAGNLDTMNRDSEPPLGLLEITR